MRKNLKSVALLFAAASAVYSGPVILADSAKSAKPAAAGKSGSAVRQLEDASSPGASAPAATTQPAPAAGQSVSASQVSVSDGGAVEIHVNDASLVEVLRMLSLQSQKNIIASKDVPRHRDRQPVRRHRS